jgi:NADH:ubiquinone oxidoreductase subunit 6 (subunit J)
MKRTAYGENSQRRETVLRTVFEATVELTSLLLFVAMVGIWALGIAG